MKVKNIRPIIATLLLICLTLCACSANVSPPSFNLSDIPPFDLSPYVVIDDNQPHFEVPQEIKTYKTFSDLDFLGRCGKAEAMLGIDLMPTEEREGIGQIKPSGWKTVKYDIVDGKYLYNRCHLIGFQLCGENANKNNLITGTRFMNTDGMLPFENMIADYIEQTKNHVLYRVTPIYHGNNLVASGVQMEGLSVEDGGKSICFNVYVYNEQPGITIDHTTGDSFEKEAEKPQGTNKSDQDTYILNTRSKKFHTPTCSGADDIQKQNRKEYTGDKQYLIDKGYTACKICGK